MAVLSFYHLAPFSFKLSDISYFLGNLARGILTASCMCPSTQAPMLGKDSEYYGENDDVGELRSTAPPTHTLFRVPNS